MDLLYTTFVSSTFKDLKLERQRIVSVLLGHQCVPFGMEFFPSTGESQWPIITKSIAAADFCVFVVAGRYGTISDDNEISWTHREFREAVALGKPIIGLLHGAPERIPADCSEADQPGRDSLQAFRQEIEGQTVCRYYESEADLIQALGACIAAIQRDKRVSGWRPATPSNGHVAPIAYDRRYEFVDIMWHFSPSKVRPGTWDAHYTGRRRLTVSADGGLAACTLDFTRETDQQLPFNEESRPILRLTSMRRDLPGQASLDPPRKQFGATFMQDVRFSPPLAPGESADFTVEGDFPAYKFATREALVAATLNAKSGPRAVDWTSRNVTCPTDRIRLSTFLPLELKAEPRGPMLGREASRYDSDLNNEVMARGFYSCEQSEVDGIEGHTLTLDVPNPYLRVRYRVGWQLPPA